MGGMQVWRMVHPPRRGTLLLASMPLVHTGFYCAWVARGLSVQVLQHLQASLFACVSMPVPPMPGRCNRAPVCCSAFFRPGNLMANCRSLCACVDRHVQHCIDGPEPHMRRTCVHAHLEPHDGLHGMTAEGDSMPEQMWGN